MPVPTGYAANTPQLDNIRAVVFDIYGTLLISGSGDIGVADPTGRGLALADAYASVGCKFQGDFDAALNEFTDVIELHHKRSREQGIDFPEVDIVAVWRETTQRFQEQGFLHEMIAEQDFPKLAVAFEVRVNPVWPMPGLIECLVELQRLGMVLGIISNAQFFTPLIFPALVKKDLDILGFARNLRYYSYRHGYAKPGQKLYELAKSGLSELEIHPREVLYVGNDMRNDIWPAGEIGFHTALFAGDKRSLRLRSEQSHNHPPADVTITHLSQIPPIIR